MLTREQIAIYDRDGYVILGGLFDPAETALLQRDAEMLRTLRRGHPDANVIEKDGVSIRAAWAIEIDSAACAAAYRLPRILGPVKQLLGDDVYLYQSRLNYKVAGKGDVFQWHQDYTSWNMDGMPRGDHRSMLTVLIMLDDTRTENGPLRFIPRSHAGGMIEPIYDTWTTSYPLHVVPDGKVVELAGQNGIVECTGPAGTVVVFCGNLVHGSTENISDRDRRNLYFAYSRCDNRPIPGGPRRKHSNNYIMNPYPQALHAVSDQALGGLAMGA